MATGFYYIARDNPTDAPPAPSTGTIVFDPFMSDAAAVKASNTQGYLGTNAVTVKARLPGQMSRLAITHYTISRDPVQGGPSTFDLIGAALAPIAPELGILGGGLAGATGTGAAGGEAATVAGGATAGSGLTRALLFGGAASAITSPTDFLSFIAWIFHPLNILRMVEFLAGFVLLGFGIYGLMQRTGSAGYTIGRSMVRAIPARRVRETQRRGSERHQRMRNAQ